ncbi:MAG: aminoacyl-histidine dipeptidase [Clostridia bacterium]|nr:aminoacyl-histidine dipeptidase [Clostridia bacterium]
MNRVFEIFEELSAIPRESGNVKAVSDWCAAYAKKRGFEAVQDAHRNCLIRVPASKGKEDHPIVILQGHLDMVCEKEEGNPHNFETDPIQVKKDGDWLTANGTTLGGDNGIAIAYCLALLDETEVSHPALELFFTADEETGMFGAFGFDPALLKGRRLLNLDSEEEGAIYVSCAGGKKVDGRMKLTWEECDKPACTITVSGLQGGHSGAEIHQGRANANILLGKILAGLNCRLISIDGGKKANAIPRSATAVVATEQALESETLTALFQREYGAKDPDVKVEVAHTTAKKMMTKDCSDGVIRLLSALPDGVREWSTEIEGLVETSLNCGIIETSEEELFALTSIRSMKNAKRDALAEQVVTLMQDCGFAAKADGEYPAWEYRADSPLREAVAEGWKKISGKEPKIIAIHAGLECGLFDQKLEGLDAVSIGPNMQDIHTPRERLSIASSVRVWEWLCKVLETL